MTTHRDGSERHSATPTTPSSAEPISRRNLSGFSGAGYDRGRNALWQVAWLLVSGLVSIRWWCPPSARVSILRAFGATIGRGVNIRHGVRIHWPWKLTVGDNSWIGEQTWILNLEPVTIGSDVCISQGVLLCTGSHDRRSPTFEFDNAPIVVGDGAWIAARATVLRGSTIGHDAVVGATALVSDSVRPGALVLAPRARPTDAVSR
ncbi:putative colanic acid biosynthesis acetyltransferase [Mycetocola zhujimingii]|uniref:Putative colanic acid biosynthesis acetyltransferase n=1 Tax=Mycetocola zhujimingii TaxID=2079792 RepID=A0A2U1TFV3_9MICO|nr:putative colanic acid biosynthesis acetyltransferase [Mycetocola zhujimingii]AWB87299.1 putative colanic acid biosynthesis acetyltransferase [Mycetocola zhujimingii]PWC07746.1 putative colanic acid biosynthesis acetyltransferase [Mycetocola zhujimingii]